MKNQQSIIGSWVSSRLIEGVFQTKSDIARCEINGGKIQFTLRKCAAKGNHSSGLLLTASFSTGAKPGFSDLKTLKKRIKPNLKSQKDSISKFATKCARQFHSEMVRLSHVEGLDRLAEKLLTDKRFIRAVVRREKSKGFSHYATMTVEQCQDWVHWALNWATRNNFNFVDFKKGEK